MLTCTMSEAKRTKDRKIYRCSYINCTSTFSRPYRLAGHLKVHLGEKPFKCHFDSCTRAYTNKSHLLRHINTNHKNNTLGSSFRCDVCGSEYSNSQNLKRHINTTHNTDVACNYCSARFPKKHLLAAHLYTHTGVESFRCDICSEKFVTLRAKKVHVRRHTVFICKCTETFTRWSKYTEHLRKLHTPKEYICNDCGRVFKKRCQIVRHVKIHNPAEQKMCFTCPKPRCPKFYAKYSNLRHHIKSVHESVTYDCNLCEAKLSSKAKLKYHLSIHQNTKRPVKAGGNGKRKIRKDTGQIKTTTALKLAGFKIPRSFENNDVLIDNNESSLSGITV